MNPAAILTAVCLGLVQYSEQVALKSAGDNVVEVYFVADYKAFQIYLTEESTTAAAKASMEADIDYFITEVNKRFKTLVNVNVIISKRKLDIIQDSTTKIFPLSIIQSSDLVGSHDALTSFDKWVTDKMSLKYDLALLWTGYDLYNTTDQTADKNKILKTGYAWMGTICEGTSATSVVEYDGTYSTVVNTAHEIAHNLGASHDAQKAGYIMSPSTSPTSTNRWAFSLCSSSDILGNFQQITENCMTSTNPVSTVPNADITTKLTDPEALCVRKKGPDSYFCRSTNFYGGSVPKGDVMCKYFYCSVGARQCATVISSDGLLCGPGKTCKEGSCQIDPTSNTGGMDENCLYGDQKTISSSGGTYSCTEFLNLYGDDYCSQSSVRSTCCKSCSERKSADPNCPYGDKNYACRNYQPHQICDRYSDWCCKTCKGYTGRRRRDASPLDVDVDMVLGLVSKAENVLLDLHKVEEDSVDATPTRISKEPQSEI